MQAICLNTSVRFLFYTPDKIDCTSLNTHIYRKNIINIIYTPIPTSGLVFFIAQHHLYVHQLLAMTGLLFRTPSYIDSVILLYYL